MHEYRTKDEATDHLLELLELVPGSTRRRLSEVWGTVAGLRALCDRNPDVAAFTARLCASARSREGDGGIAREFRRVWPAGELQLWGELATSMAETRRRHEWSLIRRLLMRLARAGDTSRSGASRGAVLDALTDAAVPWSARTRLWEAIDEAGRTANVPPDLGADPALSELSLVQTVEIRRAIDRGRRRGERSDSRGPGRAQPSALAPDESIEDREEVALLVEAVRELSEEQQTLLRLWLSGEGYRAIGDELGISPSKVGRDLAGIIARLANRLSSWIL